MQRSSHRHLHAAAAVAVLAAIGLLAMSAGASSAGALSLTWGSVSGRGPVDLTSTSTEATLELSMGGTAASSVHCSGVSSTGVIGTPQAALLSFTFTGCSASELDGPTPCQTPGASLGEIVTGNVEATLVYTDKATREVGVLINPGGASFASYECAGALVQTRGSVIGALTPVNEQTSAFKLRFSQTLGVQQPIKYEKEDGEQGRAVLEGAVNGGSFHQLGIGLIDSVTSAEAGEVRACSATPGGSLPLHISGRWIAQCEGNMLQLTSVNWSGAQTTDLVPWGLNEENVSGIVKQIVAAGFNSVRLPWSNQMVEDPQPIPDASAIEAKNPQFEVDGQLPTPLQVFDDVVKELTDAGLLVILDDHSTDAMEPESAAGGLKNKSDGGCTCDSEDGNGLWWAGYGSQYFSTTTRPTVAGESETIDSANTSEGTQHWISDWETVIGGLEPAVREHVVGADLRNEPRDVCVNKEKELLVNGEYREKNPEESFSNCQHTPYSSTRGLTWTNTASGFNWSAAAARAGRALHRLDPSLLIMVEGPDNSTNFTEVTGSISSSGLSTPLIEALQGRVVYSPHDYSWDASNYGSTASCPKTIKPENKSQLDCLLGNNWGYLITEEKPYTAPVWVGEFGTDVANPKLGETGTWFANFIEYLKSNGMSWSYWQLFQPADDFSVLSPNGLANGLAPHGCLLLEKLNEIGLTTTCMTL